MGLFRKKRTDIVEEAASVERIPQQPTMSAPPQCEPIPTAQQPFGAYRLPNTGRFEVVSNGMPMNLPTYTSIDEYGRAYTPIMTYAPQPNSAPVPVATPPKVAQLNTIVSPIAFVPYVDPNLNK